MDGQDEVINKQQEQEEQEHQKEGGSESQTIIKGKRTKRQRPQSPIPFRMITPPYHHTHNNSHNSSPTKSDHGSGICSSNNNDNNNNQIEENSSSFIDANNVDHDLTLSISTITTTSITEEEEDMANCLILLAQGQAREPLNTSPPQLQKPILTTILQDHRQDGNNNNLGAKFTSRKFMEVTTAGKSGGYYVYECKTCSKTFSSFQALGGHRASHKKPKMTHPNTIRNNSPLFTDDDDPPFTTSSSSLSLHLTNRAPMIHGNGNNGNQHVQVRPRVHECAICGAEFSSGQALGGHMRRHRGMVITPAPPPLAAVVVQQAEPMATTNTTLSLDLDLNLPAPSEDVIVDQNQQQLSSPSNNQNHQQKPLVLSSLALVDCHY